MPRIAGKDLAEILSKGPPQLALDTIAMSREMWRAGTLDLQLREMLRLKSAELARCAYASRIRYAEPREAGLTEEVIAQIADPGRSALPERDKLALQFAELLITAPDAITDAFYAEMRLHFSEPQMVELTYFVMHCNVIHRFAVAMRLPPEDGDNIVVRRLGIPECERANHKGTETQSRERLGKAGE